MVWTKLAYLSFPEAFLPRRLGKGWIGAAVGGRYRNVLKKEFLKAGVPWEYDPKHFKPKGPHPFDMAPKPQKKIALKAMRVTMIKRALARQDDLQLKYRQETANKKPNKGLDLLFQSTLGNFIKGK